jgi:ABC-type multidrug transport system fused ATPase/permease subunit
MFLNARLWKLTEGVRLRIFFAVLVGVLSSTVGIIRLALLGWLLALIYQGATFDDILFYAGIIAVVIVLRGFLEHARTMLAHGTASRVQLLLRKRLYDQVVELGPAYFGMNRTGDVLLTMVEGVEQLETYFGKYLPQLFIAFLTPLVIFVLLAFWDLSLAAILLGFAWITLLAPALFHSWDSKNSLRRQKAYANYAAEFLDTIQGLATLKAFGQGIARGRLLAARAHEVYRSTMWVLATNSLTRGITDTGIAVGTAVILCYGAYRVQAGVTSLETLLMILLAGVETFRPQRDMRALLHEGMVGLSAAHGVFSLLDARSPVFWESVATAESRQSENTDHATVRFENVTFAYPGGREAAHKTLNFQVAAGERIGFVGPSGAGKSTIMKLLLRLYDPDQGDISICGKNLKSMTTDELYGQLAVVSQDTYLFHGSVAENLRFGHSQASMAQIQHAAQLANAHSFIEDLPNGYHTVIGERGIRLSGGQRQRIAIARALLRDAPILILDEALSAVDAENEAVIQQALDRLMRGRTTLIFAHRLSSIIGCDRILVLAHGHIVESGSHDQLINQPGYYHRLMASQLEYDQLGAETNLNNTSNNVETIPVTDTDEATTKTVDDVLKTGNLGWVGVISELLNYVRAYKPHLTFTFIFGVARVLAFIGVGVLSALIVAAVKADQPYDDLVIWLGVLALASGALHWLESWIAHDMAFRMLTDLRAKLYAKLESLAPAFLVRRRSGDMVAMATHDVEMVEYFFAHTVAPAFVAVLIPALVLAVLWFYSGLLATVLIPFLLLVGLSPFLFRQRIDELGSKARESLAELNAYVVDSIQGLQEIIAFQQIDNRRNKFISQIQAHLAIRLPFFRDLSWQAALLEIATGLGGLVIVMTGAYLITTGEVSALLLPMLTILALSAFLPVSEIAQIGRQLANTLGATRRLHAVQSTPVPVVDGPGVRISKSVKKSIDPALEMDAVSFSYNTDMEETLKSVSFSVPIGSTLALVGSSGAGKTTIAHLFLRFWDPDTGSLRMHGHDLRDFKLDDLRARIALVSQDTYLFNETIRDNILMARPEADEHALNDAIQRAALEDFIAAQPLGLDTPVGERGLRLSGGQRQRVSIARAFLKDSPILILDEATSHLDAVSEAAIRHSLEDLMHDRTTVIIAHRLSTVRNADNIIAMQAGRVVEAGNHDQLLAKNGLYKQLVNRQLTAATGTPYQESPQ